MAVSKASSELHIGFQADSCLISEEQLRQEMKQIASEVDMGDVYPRYCNNFMSSAALNPVEMHYAALRMDLTIEMQFSSRMQSSIAEMQRFLVIHSEGQSRTKDMCTTDMPHLMSELDDYLIKCQTNSCVLSDGPITETKDLNNLTGVSDQNAHNCSVRPLDNIIEMCTETYRFSIIRKLVLCVHSRLIEETRLSLSEIFARHHRELLRQVFSQDEDCHRALFEKTKRNLHQANVIARQNQGNRMRRDFLEKAKLQPPPVLRLIDCRVTCERQQVVLIDYLHVQHVGYTAISHTYGMEVYEVFDCECASMCLAQKPRCSTKACFHALDQHDANAVVDTDVAKATETRNRVVRDILNMCSILQTSGVEYIWHDGVCIAQYDVKEVQETIEHIGWVYASAVETIIFLHYIGKPMAPIGLPAQDDEFDNLACRWHTRVWTLQEAALSKCRRYCVRVGTTPFGECQSLEEFEEKVALWYKEDSSKIEVIEEERFGAILKELYFIFQPLYMDFLSSSLKQGQTDTPMFWTTLRKAGTWYECIVGLLDTLHMTCFAFPTPETAIQLCSARQSKHNGDRINSILALSGVKGFVAHKDDGVEVSTIEFFRRQGQQGLAKALFLYNSWFVRSEVRAVPPQKHTWVPSLLKIKVYAATMVEGVENCLDLRVLEDGNLEVRGEMLCLEVRFTARLGLEDDFAESKYVNEGSTVKEATKCTLLDMLEADQKLAMFDMDLTPEGRPLARCAHPEAPACRLGRALVPQMCPDHGGYLEDKESFNAYLVLPRQRFLDVIASNSENSFSHCPLPVLILHGNLQASVWRVGIFEPTHFLVSCINKILDCPAITIIQSLIIT